MQLNEAERASGTLSAASLAQAVELVRHDGYVVFEAVLPREFISELRAAFLPLLEETVRRQPENRGSRRYQMHLPFKPPFCDARFIEHPIALAVVETILGSDCVCQYFASDTPLLGSDYQAVHSDIHPLFPESDLIVPAYGLVVNVNLVDFTPENGPLEIWPGGTHKMPGGVDLKGLAPRMLSHAVHMPAGSILIRDLRAWHRGTPNRTAEPRPNLALIYARHWFKTSYPPIRIPRAEFEKLSERAKKLFRFEQVLQDA
ncbi:MAG: hypothetical protein AMXMBFR7_05540 [Planctomycetota bacterium]